MLKKISRLVARAGMQMTLLASAGVLCGGLSTTAQALSFDQISQVYFFGDSLTDSGFNNIWSFPAPLPAGKAPTFTTFGGYTYAQYLARDIKGFTLPVYAGPNPADTITNNSIYPVPGFATGTLTGVDYAAGGSTTNSTGFVETWAPSLNQQIEQYIGTATGHRADPNAVYFIWSGANDLLTLLNSSPIPSQAQLLAAAQNAAINVANEVARLSASGAKRVVVLSLPNIGLTPLITGAALQTHNPALPATVKTLSFTFNSMLNSQLGRVIKQTGVKVLYVDVYTLLDNVILATKAGQPYTVSGQSFQFVNYTSPACSTVPTAIYCPSTAPNNYVFADTLHPTSMAHRVLSLQIETLIHQWK
ncbi:MAG: SGNH/GDSL hydrolase family protein [Gammaproteobacteria bacterium]|nr:SGNH/GDSL hydrolase family protein [Gammaproteobacteria bacterium]